MVTFQEELCRLLGEENVKSNEPMSRHTTFKVGGPAALFVTCKDEEQLKTVMELIKRSNMRHDILGNGSNLLVGDGGYDGLILYMGEPWKYYHKDGDCLIAGAGISMPALARMALNHSLSGLEFAAGIPGSVGGGIVMNAGAYGIEMKDVVKSVKVLDTDGEIRVLTSKEMEFGYRTSCISKNHYLVLEAVFQLKPDDETLIKARMEDYGDRRRSKQPLEYPSAGSTFKRPEGYFAGKLIEDVGLRGYQVGGAQVSEKHCGFVINKDHASAADIITLCDDVSRKVKEKFGVDLHMEVKRLGKFL